MSTPATASLAVIAILTEIDTTAIATTNDRSFHVMLSDPGRERIVGTDDLS
jgi:hypothetical protein